MTDYILEVLNKLSLILPAFLCGLAIGLQIKENEDENT